MTSRCTSDGLIRRRFDFTAAADKNLTGLTSAEGYWSDTTVFCSLS